MAENSQKTAEEEEEKHDVAEAKREAKKLAKKMKALQVTRDTLFREEALDKLTLDKIKDKWHDKLLDIKLPEMRDNLKYIMHYMEKLLDTDYQRKRNYEVERADVDEKFSSQTKTHSTALERLFDIYQKRVQDLQDIYDERVAEKKTRSLEEFALMEKKELARRQNMQVLLFQMEQTRNRKEDAMNCDMFLRLDDERSRNTERYENLRGRLEKKMEKRWGDITNALKTYQKNTLERRREYTVLKTKDDSDSRIIYLQMKRTQKLFDLLEELKNCYEKSYAPKKTISLITDLREERSKFLETFDKLKVVLAEEIKIDKKRLKQLTAVSSQTIKELRKTCKKGERILTLFRICRKFETEQEKVYPVGASIVPFKAAEVKKTREESFISYYDARSWTKDLEILNKFWVKASHARMSKYALTKYVQDLVKENAILKKSVSYYFFTVSQRK